MKIEMKIERTLAYKLEKPTRQYVVGSKNIQIVITNLDFSKVDTPKLNKALDEALAMIYKALPEREKES